MEKFYREKFFLSASDCNAEQELALTVLTGKLIETATSHANHLGIGNPMIEAKDMHAGWVLARLTIEVKSYPKANESYEIKTWVESYNRHFSMRCFEISTPEQGVCGYARSVWMIMDTDKHTNVNLTLFPLPAEVISGEPVPISMQAKHTFIFTEEEKQKDNNSLIANHPAIFHKFLYSDLDSYRHVKTVKYVTLLMNRFSLHDHDVNFVRRLELSFLHEAKYGIETQLLRSENEGTGVNSFLLKEVESDQALLFARVMMQPRKL